MWSIPFILFPISILECLRAATVLLDVNFLPWLVEIFDIWQFILPYPSSHPTKSTNSLLLLSFFDNQGVLNIMMSAAHVSQSSSIQHCLKCTTYPCRQEGWVLPIGIIHTSFTLGIFPILPFLGDKIRHWKWLPILSSSNLVWEKMWSWVTLFWDVLKIEISEGCDWFLFN